MANPSSETLALRGRLLAVLSAAKPEPLPTSEICLRAGFTKFDQHAVVSPQLRYLARGGVVVRSAASRGHEATWRLNLACDPATALLDTRRRQPRRAPVRLPQAKAWDSAYEALRQYVDEHSCLPERGYRTADGRNLRSWIETQQSTYSQGCMYPERARRLEEIECWVWAKQHGQAWNSAYEAVKEYAQEHGRLPGHGYVSADGRDLRNWIQNQQHAYKRDRLRPDRARRLGELDCWRWTKPPEEAWEEAFQALQEYVAAHGQLPPSTYVTDEGIQLGRWIKNQCSTYGRGHLSKERIARLERIDVWAWPSGISFAAANDNRALHAATSEAAKIAQLGDLAGYNLPGHLKTTAEMRRDHPDLNFSALAEHLGISKDACSGRLRRFWQAIARAAQVPSSSALTHPADTILTGE